MLHHIFEWKGINDGIKAFEIAQKAYLEIQLLMFGSRKKTVGINCEYHYRPIREELRKIYNSCDILLCSSWRGGFGPPSAEAMACKCGLVTDTGGCRDYAIHEKKALVSPPKNPETLARNLCRLRGEYTYTDEAKLYLAFCGMRIIEVPVRVIGVRKVGEEHFNLPTLIQRVENSRRWRIN